MNCCRSVCSQTRILRRFKCFARTHGRLLQLSTSNRRSEHNLLWTSISMKIIRFDCLKTPICLSFCCVHCIDSAPDASDQVALDQVLALVKGIFRVALCLIARETFMVITVRVFAGITHLIPNSGRHRFARVGYSCKISTRMSSDGESAAVSCHRESG